MTSIFKGLFGGGQEEAREQAEQSRKGQQVANDRQLAELNRSEKRAALSRRNPRGRRLFSDAARPGERQANLA